MEYRLLGLSGCAISALALGTLTFGNETSETDSFAQLDRFISAGGTLIDTADVYADGRSEQIIGRWLASRTDARGRAVIATKGPLLASTEVLASTEPAADLGGDPGSVGPARHPRGQRLHDLAHALHAGRAGLGDRRADQCVQLVVAELHGQVVSQDVSLGPFGCCLLGPAGRAERLGGLPALPGLPGEHLHDLLVAEVAGRGARHLLGGDGGQCHPQRAHPHLIARPHGGVQVRAQPFL
jgi:hypothetical protein